jgi:TolB-like protein
MISGQFGSATGSMASDRFRREVFRFGAFALDVSRGCLCSEDRDIALRPKSFEVLRYLVEHADRLISKDELIQAIWPNLFVTDDSLTRCISDVRQALGDEAQRMIKTMPRRGYIFAAPIVREDTIAAKPEIVKHSSGDAPYPLPLTLPDKPSIVVLPFANLSGDPGQDYFADGMVEDITIAVGRVAGLFVIGTGSAFTYKNVAVDTRQVGLELGVRYVLRGSVRRDGNCVRITAELTDASDGRQIWADRFEGELDSVFKMQDRVAAHVSTMLAPALRVAEIERSKRKPTENLTAYDLFLRASREYREGFEQNTEALRLLYRAVELDPVYGAAYGLAAYCHFWQKALGWISPSDGRIQEGVRLAHSAAATAKNDSEALWMASQTLGMLSGELDLALALIDKSLSLNPNSPGAWQASAVVHAFRGESDLALEHAAQARRHSPLDPLAIWFSSIIGFIYFFAERYEEAATAIEEVLKKEPNFPPALRMQMATYGLLGRIDEGHESVRRLRAVVPDTTIASQRAFFEPPLCQNPRALDKLIEGMRLSGLPEI